MTENIENYFTPLTTESFNEQDDKKRNLYLKFEEGRTQIRILPAPIDERSPFTRTFEHWYQVEGKPYATFLLCPRRMAGGKCPVCDEANALFSTGVEADIAEAKRLNPKQKFIYRVIKRGEGGEPDSEPLLMKLSWTMHEALKILHEEYGDYTHPISGYDIVIRKTKDPKNKYPSYADPIHRPSSPLASSNERILELIKNPISLDDATRVLPYKELVLLLAPPSDDELDTPQVLQVTNTAKTPKSLPAGTDDLEDFDL